MGVESEQGAKKERDAGPLEIRLIMGNSGWALSCPSISYECSSGSGELHESESNG